MDINELKVKAYDLSVKLKNLDAEGKSLIEEIRKTNDEIVSLEKDKK